MATSAPTTVAAGYDESCIDTVGAATGMRYGATSRSVTNISVPNAIAGSAASHRPAGRRPLRDQLRRNSRALAGGPRPEHQAQMPASTTQVTGSAHGISEWNLMFPKSGSTDSSEPASSRIQPAAIARRKTGSRFQRAFNRSPQCSRPRAINVLPSALALGGIWVLPIARRSHRLLAVALAIAALLLVYRLWFGSWWAWPLGTFLLVTGSIAIAFLAVSFLVATAACTCEWMANAAALTDCGQ